jgi:hypothetical protein
MPARYAQPVIVLRAFAGLGLVGLLAGCTPAAPTPTPGPSASIAAACTDAVAAIVTAAADLVGDYGGMTPTADEAPAEAAPSPSPTDVVGSGDELSDAVTAARQTRTELGCDEAVFTARLEAGLLEIDAEGAIAGAVLRRVSASLLGTVRDTAGEWAVEAGEELADVLARAAPGTVVVLPSGEYSATETLVLLEGVTLRGAGMDATTLRSTASGAAIIVATAGLVRLENLSLTLASEEAASGLIAGPSASVALVDVRVSGAVAAADGTGGAGVYLSAVGVEASGRGTTLEITGSRFESNGWAGVAVAGGHRVSIESSSFTSNASVGIVFLDTASGSVASSTFADNGVGIAVTGSATPTLLASTISGGSVGVQMDASSAPIIDSLEVSESATAGLIFGAESAGSVTATRCAGVPYGIVVADTAAPTIGQNDCTLARGGS